MLVHLKSHKVLYDIRWIAPFVQFPTSQEQGSSISSQSWLVARQTHPKPTKHNQDVARQMYYVYGLKCSVTTEMQSVIRSNIQWVTPTIQYSISTVNVCVTHVTDYLYLCGKQPSEGLGQNCLPRACDYRFIAWFHAGSWRWSFQEMFTCWAPHWTHVICRFDVSNESVTIHTCSTYTSWKLNNKHTHTHTQDWKAVQRFVSNTDHFNTNLDKYQMYNI